MTEQAPSVPETDAKPRKGTMKGGHDPRELARLAAKSKRERREAAARDAELDKLTVQARLAVGIAGELTADKLRQVLAALVARALEPGHVGTNAAALVFQLAARATEGGEEDELGPDLRWEDMTQAQRAVARARADELARRLALENLGEAGEAPPSA